MRELLIAIIGLVFLWACGRGTVARKERAKGVAIGLGLLAIGVYRGAFIYHQSVTDLLLLDYRLPPFKSLRVDVLLVLGYGVFVGAALSMFFPARSGST